MLLGRLPWGSAALLLLGILAVALLTARGNSRIVEGDSPIFGHATMLRTVRRGGRKLGQSPGGLRPAGTRRFASWAILGCWIVVNGAIAALLAGPFLPRAYVILLFVLTGLWIVWSAWMFSWSMRAALRPAILTALLVLAAISAQALKADGLTGSGTLNLAWRWTANRKPAQSLDPDVLDRRPPENSPLPPSDPASDYPQFLGPQRRAVVEHARLSRDWTGSPPRLVWRKPLGAGWGGFAVVGDYTFTQEQRGQRECVVCYRVPTGEVLWCHADCESFNSSAGPGPRATPTVASDNVYTVGATGLLNCLQAATGDTLWSVNILSDNQAENLAHGVSGSPLVVGDRVVVSPTGSNGISLAAYHKQTGKRLWRAGSDQASYSSPMLVTLAGIDQIVLHTSAGLTAHEVATGRLLWSFPWTNSEGTNCAQPMANAGGPDQLFVSTGYGKGGALLRLAPPARSAPPGADLWQPQIVWTSRALASKFSTAVLWRDHIYGLDDGRLVCVSVATGQRRWRAGHYHHGQLLLAGGLLLVQAEEGEVFLVEPAPEGPRELGHFSALDDKTWNNPALAGRFLLVRNDREAACYELPMEAM